MREIQTYKEANMEMNSTSLVLVLTWRFNVTEPCLQASVELCFCTMSGWNSTDVLICFVVAPCMMIVLSPLYIHLMHKNYYKIVKQLKSFKIIIVAPTCFGLRKPSSGSSQPVLR